MLIKIESPPPSMKMSFSSDQEETQEITHHHGYMPATVTVRINLYPP